MILIQMQHTFEQKRQNTYLRTCAPSADSDQRACILQPYDVASTWILRCVSTEETARLFANVIFPHKAPRLKC